MKCDHPDLYAACRDNLGIGRTGDFADDLEVLADDLDEQLSNSGERAHHFGPDGQPLHPVAIALRRKAAQLRAALARADGDSDDFS